MATYKIVVQKFGGTSVMDAQSMRGVIDIVRTKGVTSKTRPLVVLSACAGVTNALIRIGELALLMETAEALHEIDLLEERHATIAHGLIRRPAALNSVLKSLAAMWIELRRHVRGVNLLRELTPRSRDQFQSVGERASTLIFSSALNEVLMQHDIPVALYDAREFFITSSEFTVARPLTSDIERRMRKIKRALSNGAVGVSQGFIGSTKEGVTTTIGRGGSDFSAAIQGVALAAKEIQIWTDVPGIMTTDPRLVPDAFTIPKVSFSDACHLAYFGAKVLHPETIWPAVQARIPVLVLSSKEPRKGGTSILADVPSDNPITGIAVRKNVALVRIASHTMLPDVRVQQAVWDVFATAGIVPQAVSLSLDSALYALESAEQLTGLRSRLEQFGIVEFIAGRSIVTLVGSGLKSAGGISARILRALGRNNCEMISYGGAETTMSIVVEDHLAGAFVKKLHKEFYS